jgi:hypothetical protein
MTFAFLSVLDEYWWLVLFIVFWGLMFTGKRIDRFLDWITDRKMSSLYGNFGAKYKDELFDYNAYLSKLLGADVKLDELILKTERTNERIFKDELVRVTYLELWILVKIYGKNIVKSDEHIYYIDKRYFKKVLKLDLKEINLWAMEFINSKEIRDLKIEASFVLHKVRTNDPHCDPNMNAGSSAVEAIVFDKDYIFSSRKRIKGELENDKGIIKLNDGSIVEFDKSGYHFVGNNSDMNISEKIEVFTSSDKSTDIIKDESVSKRKISKEKSTMVENDNSVISVKSDGSVTKQDSSGIPFTFNSDVDKLKDGLGEMEEPGEDEIEIDLKVTEITIGKNIASKLENKISSENIGEQKSLDLDFFEPKETREPKKPKKVQVSKESKQSNPKVTAPKKNQDEKIISQKDEEEDILINYVQLLEKVDVVSYGEFLERLATNKDFLPTYFSKEENEIYWDDITSTYYISITHILIFISKHYVDAEEMRYAFFPEGNFEHKELERLVKILAGSYTEGLDIFNILRKEFHRADDGYKEIYTFAEITALDIGNFQDSIVKGKASRKYRNAKVKKFAEQFLD